MNVFFCCLCCAVFSAGLIWDFLEFPLVKSSKIFTAYRIQQDMNLKHEKSRVFFRFLQICLLLLWKNWSYRLPWKSSQTNFILNFTFYPNNGVIIIYYLSFVLSAFAIAKPQGSTLNLSSLTRKFTKSKLLSPLLKPEHVRGKSLNEALHYCTDIKIV